KYTHAVAPSTTQMPSGRRRRSERIETGENASKHAVATDEKSTKWRAESNEITRWKVRAISTANDRVAGSTSSKGRSHSIPSEPHATADPIAGGTALHRGISRRNCVPQLAAGSMYAEFVFASAAKK